MGQTRVGQSQAGPDLQVADRELVEPDAFVREPPSEPVQCPVRPGCELRASDSEGQRQAAAQLCDPRRRGRLRGDARRAGYAFQQLDGLVPLQHAQRQAARGLEARERSPAGHQCRAGRVGRQQAADLGFSGRVVEDDQQAPSGKPCPVQHHPLPRVLRDRRAVDPERSQEARQHFPRLGRPRLARPEISEQLPIRELGPELMGRPERQGRLADAALARDHDDGGRDRVPPFQQPTQVGQLWLAPGEIADGRRELGRNWRGEVWLCLVSQPQHPFGAPQLGPRPDGQVAPEAVTGCAVGGCGLRAAAAPAQGEHQPRLQALAQRMRGSQRAELRHQCGGPAELQVRVYPLLERVEAPLLQPSRDRLRQRSRGGPDQRRAAPERQRFGEEVAGAARRAGRELPVRLRHQRLETMDIELPWSHPQQVASVLGPQQVASQPGAQVGHVALDHVPSGGRRIVAPELVHECLRRDDLVRA